MSDQAYIQHERYFGEQEASVFTDQQRCHQVFKVVNYEEQKNKIPKRAEGTCQWAFRSSEYIRWWESKGNNILWVSAGPGCGKSVLARSMIDDYMDSSHPSVRICYFFFNGYERNDLAAAMCSVLHQLFSQQPHLLRFAIPIWKKKGDKLRQDVEELWHIFVTAALAEASCKTVCIFDALDECREADQVRLIEKLGPFRRDSSSSKQDAWLKFLVTSRPYDHIQDCFRSLTTSFPHLLLVCEEYNDHIQKEIDVIVRIKVKELAETAQLSQDVTRRLEQQLLQMKNRTYLWLHLAMDDIRSKFKDSLWPAEEIIRMISPSLHSVHSVYTVYERILDQVPSSQVVTMRAILQIIIAARRPLTIREMGMALGVAIRPKSRTIAEAIISPQDLEKKLRWLGGLFVYTDDSKVGILHQTAREFLIRGEIASQPGSWYSLNLQDAETLMARICLQYLSIEDLKTNRSGTISQDSSLLEYSAVFWPDHVRSMNSSPNPNQEVDDLLEQLYNTKTELFSLWFPIFWKARMPHISVPIMDSVHLAAFNGHDKVLRRLIARDDTHINTPDTEDCYPVIWSSLNGHDNVVRILLDCGANVNAQGGFYGTALQAACHRGHDDIVQILLERGADVNAQVGSYRDALQAACFKAHDNIVRILLERRADINDQGGSYETALHAACHRGHNNIVQILLERGADVNAQGGYYGTALKAASFMRYDNIVQILLDRGADASAHGGSNGSVGCSLQTSVFDRENRSGARSGAAYPSSMPTSQSKTKVDSQLVISLSSSRQKAGLETDQAETMSSNISPRNEIEKDVVPDDCDAETTYSVGFTLDHSPLLYLQAFADQLASDIRNIANVSNTSDISPQSLDELLKAFSWKLHGESSTPFQWEAAVTLHHKRKQIINYLISDRHEKALEADDKEATEGSVSDSELLERRPFEKDSKDVLDWVNDTEPYGEPDQGGNTANMTQEEVGFQLPEYANFIQQSVAYKDWLLSNIRKIGRLEPGNPDLMLAISAKVRSQLRAFDLLRKMSHRRPQSLIKMTFNLDWDPAHFIQSQDADGPGSEVLNNLEKVVCLTGSWNNAQAATVVEYMDQTWPGTGGYIIALLKELIRLPKGQACSYQLPGDKSSPLKTHGLKNPQLTACIEPPSSCSITAIGDRFFVSEIAEQIGWLASALRSSHQGVVACYPCVQDFDVFVRGEESSTRTILASCSIVFEFEQGIKMLNASHAFYSNSGIRSEILVRGYPVRTELVIDLEKAGEDVEAKEDCYGSAIQADSPKICLPIASSKAEKHLHEQSVYKKSIWVSCISRCLSWSRRMMRPRLQSGFRRIEWKCDCGVDLYADFLNDDAENLDKLATSLQNPGQESTNSASNTPCDSSNTPIRDEPVHSLPIQSSFDSSTANDEHTAASSSGQPQSGDRQTTFLALCVNTGAIYKTLTEIETSSLRSDAVAFSLLKKEYLRTRGLYSLFSFLATPIDIEYIQFTLWNLRGGYISVCDRPNCIPPDNCYEYEFSRPLTPLPPMPPGVFIHYLLGHGEGDLNPVRNDWLPRLPKRKDKRVIDCGEACFGWGIHVIEGPNREVIFWIMVVTIFAGALAGVLWSALKNDVQGGTGIGALIVALPPAFLTAILFRIGGI